MNNSIKKTLNKLGLSKEQINMLEKVKRVGKIKLEFDKIDTTFDKHLDFNAIIDFNIEDMHKMMERKSHQEIKDFVYNYRQGYNESNE